MIPQTLYIIAGTKNEFDNWCLNCVKNERYVGTKFVFVAFSDVLRGLSNPEGLCIGTWRDREDIYDILQFLHIAAKDIKKQNAIMNLSGEVDAYRKKRMIIKSYE